MNLGKEPIIFFREENVTMKQFWDLFAKSVIIQGGLTLGILGLIAYLLITKQEVPDQLWYAFSSVLGFFFGSKVQQKVG